MKTPRLALVLLFSCSLTCCKRPPELPEVQDETSMPLDNSPPIYVQKFIECLKRLDPAHPPDFKIPEGTVQAQRLTYEGKISFGEGMARNPETGALFVNSQLDRFEVQLMGKMSAEFPWASLAIIHHKFQSFDYEATLGTIELLYIFTVRLYAPKELVPPSLPATAGQVQPNA